jgi:hypothetical protein
MLLGPAKFLSFRYQVKNELENLGYTVRIMEEYSEVETDSALDDKLERIIAENEPVIFIAFFHKDMQDIDGVIFEIGFISGLYHPINIGDRLLLLGDKGFSWDNTSSYVKSSLSKVRSNCYDEEREYRKASMQIHHFVIGIKNKNASDKKSMFGRIFNK